MVEKVLERNMPTLLLGGGGYNKENVARCWTLESASAIHYQFAENELLPSTLKYYNKYQVKRLFY